jgi:hypothetical protein
MGAAFVIVCLAVLVLSILGIMAHVMVNNNPELKKKQEAAQAAKRAKAARYCTKHRVVRRGPGGPDRLVWVYGVHRTPGNACDGPEHHRASWWW